MPDGRRLSAAASLLAVLLLAAGCQSTNGDGGSGALDAVTTSADAQRSEDDVTSTTTAEAESTTVTEAAEQAAAESGETTFTTVRIEQGETGELLDQELVDDKMAEAVLVAGDNWFSCVMDPENCDFERDVGPSVSGSFELSLSGGLPLTYLEPGARYRPGPVEIRTVVEVVASNRVPVIGQVTLCQVDTGEVYIPAEDGRSEEIVNDDVAGLFVTYIVIQNEDGVLTVNSHVFGERRADETFCDDYL